jgi:hypothetical protein
MIMKFDSDCSSGLAGKQCHRGQGPMGGRADGGQCT